MSKGLKIYKTASHCIGMALPLWLKRRIKHGKEDKNRIGERFGLATITKPEGDIIWLHGASVGETKMLLLLVKKILEYDKNIFVLVTSGTITSARLLAENLPKRAIHQFFPADTPKSTASFLSYWQPKAAFFAESEIWPNMIMSAKQHGVKLALINARMGRKSLSRWQKFAPEMARQVFGAFDIILAADNNTKTGLEKLLNRKIKLTGNLKNANPPPAINKQELKNFQKALAGRKIWCAASTHKGEEELLLPAVKKIQKSIKNSLLILAPRHPERAAAIEQVLSRAGFDICKYSSGKTPGKNNDILLMDAMGHMGMVYGLSDIAFIAGSLLPKLKGHNPLEPAHLDCAIISGKYVESFADNYQALKETGGVIMLDNFGDLAKNIIFLFENPDKMQNLAKAAKKHVVQQISVFDNVWNELEILLKEALS